MFLVWCFKTQQGGLAFELPRWLPAHQASLSQTSLLRTPFGSSNDENFPFEFPNDEWDPCKQKGTTLAMLHYHSWVGGCGATCPTPHALGDKSRWSLASGTTTPTRPSGCKTLPTHGHTFNAHFILFFHFPPLYFFLCPNGWMNTALTPWHLTF